MRCNQRADGKGDSGNGGGDDSGQDGDGDGGGDGDVTGDGDGDGGRNDVNAASERVRGKRWVWSVVFVGMVWIGGAGW